MPKHSFESSKPFNPSDIPQLVPDPEPVSTTESEGVSESAQPSEPSNPNQIPYMGVLTVGVPQLEPQAPRVERVSSEPGYSRSDELREFMELSRQAEEAREAQTTDYALGRQAVVGVVEPPEPRTLESALTDYQTWRQQNPHA